VGTRQATRCRKGAFSFAARQAPPIADCRLPIADADADCRLPSATTDRQLPAACAACRHPP